MSNDFDFNTIISAAFTGAIERAVAPLVAQIESLEQKLNLMESRYGDHITSGLHTPAVRVDALYDLLGAMVAVNDDAIEEARQGRATLRDEFAARIAEASTEKAIDYTSDEFADAVEVAIGDRAETISESLIDSMRGLKDEKIRDAVASVIEAGSFNIEFSRY